MYQKNLEVYLDSGMAGSRLFKPHHQEEISLHLSALLLLLPPSWGRWAVLACGDESVPSSSRPASCQLCNFSADCLFLSGPSQNPRADSHWPIWSHVDMECSDWLGLHQGPPPVVKEGSLT